MGGVIYGTPNAHYGGWSQRQVGGDLFPHTEGGVTPAPPLTARRAHGSPADVRRASGAPIIPPRTHPARETPEPPSYTGPEMTSRRPVLPPHSGDKAFREHQRPNPPVSPCPPPSSLRPFRLTDCVLQAPTTWRLPTDCTHRTADTSPDYRRRGEGEPNRRETS